MARVDNLFIKNNYTVIERKFQLDRDIFNWIECQKFTIPSISTIESCKSFIAFYKIDEGELTLAKMEKTFTRIQKELFEEQKTK